MQFERLCQDLQLYFSNHCVFRLLIPFALPIFLLCSILQFISFFIYFGSLLFTLTFLLFWISVFFLLSSSNFLILTVGFSIFALRYLISFTLTIVQNQMLDWSAFLYLLFYGGLAFLSYRKIVFYLN